MTGNTLCILAIFIGSCSSTEKQSDTASSTDDTNSSDSTDTTSTDTIENGDLNGDGCPEENFITVSEFSGPGGNYPDPTLSVSCDNTHMNVLSNGIPHFEFQELTPNPLSTQDYNWEIPLNPEVASQTTDIPLLGTVGIAVNGLPFYGPNEGEFPDPYGDPVYNGIMDFCSGHTGGNSDYHFHALLVECFTSSPPFRQRPFSGNWLCP